MKLRFTKIDKLSIIAILILVIGIIRSYSSFGVLSVVFSVTLPVVFVINCFLALYGVFKKKYYYSIGVVIHLLFCPFFFQLSSITAKAENKDYISLLSFNVRSFKQPILANSKQNASSEIIKIIDSIKPDILLLQESAYKEGIKIKNYDYIFLGYRKNVKKSLLAIYSKYPMINQGYLDFPNSLNNAIYADLLIKGDTITVYNTHLQSFRVAPHIIADKYNDYDYWKNLNNTISKQAEQATLIKNHANKSTKKIIISGDFNATPYSHPYRILKKELNDSYISNGNGFGATYTRLCYPLRLDFFLSDKQIDVIRHENFDLNLSDHEPIYTKFNIK